MLVCVAGQKTIWLAPPGTETIESLPYWVENNGEKNTEFLEYNPSIDMYRSPRWQRVDLGPGETLFLPAKWWHDVYSTSDSIGVSINLVTRRSTDKRPKKVMKSGEDGGGGDGDSNDGGGHSQKQRRTTPARMTATDKGFRCTICKKGGRELLKLREKDEHLKNPPYYCDECSSPKIKGTQVSRVDFLMSIGGPLECKRVHYMTLPKHMSILHRTVPGRYSYYIQL